MKVISNENVVFFDVDDTLVMWDRTANDPFKTYIYITDPYDEKQMRLEVHTPHVKLLKNLKARENTIVVWSQSGYEWSEAVVKALNITEYVDYCMTKPKTYVDDLPVTDWLVDRIYISPQSDWAHTKENNK